MDLKQQKAETEQIFREIASMEDLPARAVIAFQFVPEDRAADWDTFTEALEAQGYAVEWYEAEDDEDEDCFEVTTPEVALNVETLWAEEEKLTLLAAVHGFAADGWGFMGA
ncbi:ribonuclease E inhibitor RraB [Rhodobacter lacus]|uniref:Ribonuclease E inhibitor RraB n=1 Tax=Rhodobacter lacus TaxID=1641972 RepID=A0ABW5A5F9_9RHOB